MLILLDDVDEAPEDPKVTIHFSVTGDDANKAFFTALDVKSGLSAHLATELHLNPALIQPGLRQTPPIGGGITD